MMQAPLGFGLVWSSDMEVVPLVSAKTIASAIFRMLQETNNTPESHKLFLILQPTLLS